jgi:hypothetical protein
MILLEEWRLRQGRSERRIELYRGDLACLPLEHAVDLLVVSAFPNDYAPTARSLIGSLYRNGVSVSKLSLAKAKDLRSSRSLSMRREG